MGQYLEVESRGDEMFCKHFVLGWSNQRAMSHDRVTLLLVGIQMFPKATYPIWMQMLGQGYHIFGK